MINIKCYNCGLITGEYYLGMGLNKFWSLKCKNRAKKTWIWWLKMKEFEEIGVFGYNEQGQIVRMGGQFKAKECKAYFDALKENMSVEQW